MSKTSLIQTKSVGYIDIQPNGVIFCDVCKKRVETFTVKCEPIPNFKYVFHGPVSHTYSDITHYKVECHGEFVAMSYNRKTGEFKVTDKGRDYFQFEFEKRGDSNAGA